MKIRTMQLRDYKQVIMVWKKAGLAVDEAFDDSKKAFKLMLQMNPKTCLAADAGRLSIVGAVLAGFNGRMIWIYRLAVLPKYQKQGIGTILVKHIEKYFKDLKGFPLKLTVNYNNLTTTSFYQKLGFIVDNNSITLVKRLA